MYRHEEEQQLKKMNVDKQTGIHLSHEYSQGHSDAQWHEGDDVEGTFVIQQILQHLAAKHGINVDQMMFREEKRCPTCEMTLKDIAHVGKFGCHDCYDTFRDDVADIVRRVQGGHLEHSGKYPKSSHTKRALKRQIEEKRAYLETLVAQQAFEEAAVVRDEIQALEETQQSEVSRRNDE